MRKNKIKFLRFFTFTIFDSSQLHRQNKPLTTSTISYIFPIVMSDIPTVLLNSGEWYEEREFPIRLQSCIQRERGYDGDGDGDGDGDEDGDGDWKNNQEGLV